MKWNVFIDLEEEIDVFSDHRLFGEKGETLKMEIKWIIFSTFNINNLTELVM